MRIGYSFYDFYMKLSKPMHQTSLPPVLSSSFLIARKDYWMELKQYFLLILMVIVYDTWRKTYISNSKTQILKLFSGRQHEQSTKKTMIKLSMIYVQSVRSQSIGSYHIHNQHIGQRFIFMDGVMVILPERATTNVAGRQHS